MGLKGKPEPRSGEPALSLSLAFDDVLRSRETSFHPNRETNTSVAPARVSHESPGSQAFDGILGACAPSLRP